MSTQTLTLTIRSPRETKEFTFNKTTKVLEVIEQARVAFGFAEGNFTLSCESDDSILQPERPLTSYHLDDGATLLLIPETGSGV